MTVSGSSLTLIGKEAQCAVCDRWVPIGRKAGDTTLRFAAHPVANEQGAAAGYHCCESGDPVPPSRLRRAR